MDAVKEAAESIDDHVGAIVRASSLGTLVMVCGDHPAHAGPAERRPGRSRGLDSQTAHPAASSGACSRRSSAIRILANSSACSLPSLRGFLVSQHNCGLCPTSHHPLQSRCILHHSKIHFPKAVS